LAGVVKLHVSAPAHTQASHPSNRSPVGVSTRARHIAGVSAQVPKGQPFHANDFVRICKTHPAPGRRTLRPQREWTQFCPPRTGWRIGAHHEARRDVCISALPWRAMHQILVVCSSGLWCLTAALTPAATASNAAFLRARRTN
jgi:hypothetical protein